MVFNEINTFRDPIHESLMGIWWTGVLLKQASRKFFKKHLITEYQFNAMMILRYATKPISQQALSNHLLVDKSNTTALVDSLEKLKFIKRTKVSKDRRFYHLKITDQGIAFIDEIEKPYRELIHRIMSVFSEQEIRDLTEKMVRIQQNLEKVEIQ